MLGVGPPIYKGEPQIKRVRKQQLTRIGNWPEVISGQIYKDYVERDVNLCKWMEGCFREGLTGFLDNIQVATGRIYLYMVTRVNASSCAGYMTAYKRIKYEVRTSPIFENERSPSLESRFPKPASIYIEYARCVGQSVVQCTIDEGGKAEGGMTKNPGEMKKKKVTKK